MKKMLRTLAVVFALFAAIIVAAPTNAEAAHSHSWKLTKTVKATCKKTGYKQYKCTGCGKTKKVTIKKTSHTYKLTASKAATTKSNGYKKYTCTCCKATKTTTIKVKAVTGTAASVQCKEADTFKVDTKDRTYTVKTSKGTKKVTGHFDSAMEKQLVNLLNSYRKSKGLNTLTAKKVLGTAADTRATEITVLFSHTRPNGTKWSTVSKYLAGENIACGYSNAASLMNAWKNSASHNANMLYANYKTIGISVFAEKTVINGITTYTYYAVQSFGR